MSFVPGMEFAGGFHIIDPAFEVYTANITPDPDTGIGTWTDEQIMTAIRTGKTPDGKIIFPPMPVPTYNAMSDDDVKAIVAYLRTVKPVHNEVPESTYRIPQETMPPAKGVAAPDPSDKIAYGGYIVNALAHCFECHTPFTKEMKPDIARIGAGGFEISLAPGITFMTANITPDPETGIGAWTDDEIKRAITQGISKDGRHLSPPMPFTFFANMTPEDLDAVVAYLHTIPPVVNKVERSEFQKKAFGN
jgi:mono/diheme cytochrome c family protein